MSANIFDLIDNKDWDELRATIQTTPEVTINSVREETSFMGGDGSNLALHEVCMSTPPLDVVQLIHKANPDCISQKGQWGFLPIHYAVSSGVSYEVVQFLLQQYPEGAYQGEDNNLLPIHLACKWAASRDVIIEVLTVYPDASKKTDNFGSLPVHYAEKLPVMNGREATIETMKIAELFHKVSDRTRGHLNTEKDEEVKRQTSKIMEEINSQKSKLREESKRFAVTQERWENESRVLKQTLEESEATNKQITSKLNVTMHQLECQKATVSTQRARSEEDAQKIAKLTKSKSDLESKLNSVQTHFKKTKLILGETSTKLDLEQKKSSELHEQILKLAAELVDTETSHNNAMAEVKESKATEIKNREQKIAQQTVEIDKLAARVTSLHVSNGILTDELENMKEINAALQEKSKDLVESQKTVTLKEAMIQELSNRVNLHEKAEAALAKKAVRLEKSRRDLRDDLRVALGERDAIRHQMNGLQLELNRKEQSLQVYKERVDQVHTWVKTFSLSLETWTPESAWIQKFNTLDGKLNHPETIARVPSCTDEESSSDGSSDVSKNEKFITVDANKDAVSVLTSDK